MAPRGTCFSYVVETALHWLYPVNMASLFVKIVCIVQVYVDALRHFVLLHNFSPVYITRQIFAALSYVVKVVSSHRNWAWCGVLGRHPGKI